MARAAENPAIEPAFAIGETVRVLPLYPLRGHIRAPHYLRGRQGAVIRYYGLFHDPTSLATGAGDNPVVGLYQVVFDHRDVWSGRAPAEKGRTRIVADIYENWLEKV